MSKFFCDTCNEFKGLHQPESHRCPPVWAIFTHGQDEQSAEVLARDEKAAAESYLNQHHVDHDYCDEVELEIAPLSDVSRKTKWVVRAHQSVWYSAEAKR